MATTRIMPLHVGKGRTESRAISDIIDYVANPQKTDEYSGQQVYTVRLLGNRLAIMQSIRNLTNVKPAYAPQSGFGLDIRSISYQL